MTFSGFTFANTSLTFLLTNSRPSNSSASDFPSPSASTFNNAEHTFEFDIPTWEELGGVYTYLVVFLIFFHDDQDFFAQHGERVSDRGESAVFGGLPMATSCDRQRGNVKTPFASREGAMRGALSSAGTHLQRREDRGVKSPEEAQERPEDEGNVLHGQARVEAVHFRAHPDDDRRGIDQEVEDGAGEFLELTRDVLVGEHQFVVVGGSRLFGLDTHV